MCSRSACCAAGACAFGSNASVELSWHVGFNPNSERIAARQRTDALGPKRHVRRLALGWGNTVMPTQEPRTCGPPGVPELSLC